MLVNLDFLTTLVKKNQKKKKKREFFDLFYYEGFLPLTLTWRYECLRREKAGCLLGAVGVSSNKKNLKSKSKCLCDSLKVKCLLTTRYECLQIFDLGLHARLFLN